MINFRFLIPLFLVILLFVVVLLNKISQIYDENREIIGWSRNTSRDLAVYIRPKQATTILESKICHDNNHPMLLLIVVCSAVKNFKARETIRETWGNTSYFNYQLFEKMHGIETASYLEVNSKDWRIYAKTSVEDSGTSRSFPLKSSKIRIGVVFLLGISATDRFQELQSKVNEEHKTYGDIIQEDFIDCYNNLTLKTMFMLKWVQNNCVNKIKYLMKTDDDAFINVPNMIHVLLGGTIPVYKSAVPYYDEKSIFATRENNRLTNKSNLMLGSKYCNKGRITNPWSKWFVPDYMFSPYEYPEYFSGIGYIIGIDAAIALYEESFSVPIFFIEDVYLTGIVAEKLKLKLTHHPLFMHYFVRDSCAARGILCHQRCSSFDLKKLFYFVIEFSIKCKILEKDFSLNNLKIRQPLGCHLN